jgi:hypothetical protein
VFTVMNKLVFQTEVAKHCTSPIHIDIFSLFIFQWLWIGWVENTKNKVYNCATTCWKHITYAAWVLAITQFHRTCFVFSSRAISRSRIANCPGTVSSLWYQHTSPMILKCPSVERHQKRQTFFEEFTNRFYSELLFNSWYRIHYFSVPCLRT